MSYNCEIGQRLKEARLDKGLSQRQLAARIGMRNSNYLSILENNHFQPTLYTAVLIADALGVSLDWLAGRTDNKGGNNG